MLENLIVRIITTKLQNIMSNYHDTMNSNFVNGLGDFLYFSQFANFSSRDDHKRDDKWSKDYLPQILSASNASTFLNPNNLGFSDKRIVSQLTSPADIIASSRYGCDELSITEPVFNLLKLVSQLVCKIETTVASGTGFLIGALHGTIYILTDVHLIKNDAITKVTIGDQVIEREPNRLFFDCHPGSQIILAYKNMPTISHKFKCLNVNIVEVLTTLPDNFVESLIKTECLLLQYFDDCVTYGFGFVTYKTNNAVRVQIDPYDMYGDKLRDCDTGVLTHLVHGANVWSPGGLGAPILKFKIFGNSIKILLFTNVGYCSITSLARSNTLNANDITALYESRAPAIMSAEQCEPQPQMQQSASKKEYNYEILQKLKEQNDKLIKQVQCNKCNALGSMNIFLPCGHLYLCKSCSGPVYTCEMCNTSVMATVETFLA